MKAGIIMKGKEWLWKGEIQREDGSQKEEGGVAGRNYLFKKKGGRKAEGGVVGRKIICKMGGVNDM
jgi:hypothetical protein